jgi:hypothetical protein
MEGQFFDDANSKDLARAGVMQDMETDKPSNQVTIAQTTSSGFDDKFVGNGASAQGYRESVNW